jgi:hypothetical protein
VCYGSILTGGKLIAGQTGQHSRLKVKKVDANQSEIVDGLRRVGAAVKSIASIGKGFPDLLVGYRGVWYVAELKDGKKPPSQRQLTPAEKAWHQSCAGKAPVHVWTSLEDALKTIGGVGG